MWKQFDKREKEQHFVLRVWDTQMKCFVYSKACYQEKRPPLSAVQKLNLLLGLIPLNMNMIASKIEYLHDNSNLPKCESCLKMT